MIQASDVNLDEALVDGCRCQVHVHFDEQKQFILTGQLGAGPSKTYELLVEDPEGRERLFDLMGLVRKGQHIAICATMDVEASDRYTGFNDVTLRPMALPELAWDDLNTNVSFLGQTFPLPLLITGMTGGLSQGAEINKRLARVAQHYGIPMGVGSQRVALENPDHAGIFTVKSFAPKLFLIGNVGIAQIGSEDAVEKCRRAVDMIEADALAIHVNVLQEVVQVEGDKDFRNIFDSINRVVRNLDVPVIVKEVGCGIDVETARRLVETGVAAIDCGGKGGTSWSLIEGARAKSQVTQQVGLTFRDWGIPTAFSVATVHQAIPSLPLIATGGIRDGLTVAKAVALGASSCGIGLPIFKAALESEEAPFSIIETFTQGLRTAMICSGARDLSALHTRLMFKRPFREGLEEWTGNLSLAPME
jgi:isopentenyl-diphosphate delta-isomerase